MIRHINHLKHLKFKATKSMDLDIDINIGVCTSKYADNLDSLIKKAMESVNSITSKSRNKIKLYTGK